MITEFIAAIATDIIASTGYVGLFFLMFFESIFPPMPSEAIMPFAGFLVLDGTLSFWGVIIAGTLGSVTGSLGLYFIGAKGGRVLIEKYGKKVGITSDDIFKAEKFFKKHGEATTFFGRFIPVVRHLISIPAGIGHMPLGKFVLFTTLGVGLWNTLLLLGGIFLKDNWSTVMEYIAIIDIIVVVVLIVLIGHFIHRHLQRMRKQKRK